MNVLVVGASRGSGRAVVRALVEEGHTVTAFARSASTTDFGEDVRTVDGDVMNADAVAKAMVGQDAVVVTLGISDNPIRVRLTRRATTALDVRSAGTRQVAEAMAAQGVRRLLVQTTYGLGDSFARLPLTWKAIFRLVLKPQIEDSSRQEEIVRASGLDWTLVRPVSLTDDGTAEPPKVALDDEIAGMKVARDQVAQVEAQAVSRPEWVGATLAVSA